MKNKNILSDLSAGIVVFLVALPLCLGISLASGAPFFSGIISGAIGGIVVGIISSSKLSVSGPAAGLAALVLAAITNIGDYSMFLCAVIIAGAIQILIGIARLGGIANYFPSSVIKGMLTSIGILIIAKQIPHAIGYNKSEHNSESNALNESSIFDYISHIHWGVLLVCVTSILIMIFWEKSELKARLKFIPGALIAVIVSVIINELFKLSNSSFAIEQNYLVSLEVPNSVSDFISYFTVPNLRGFTNSQVIITGVMIAIIASLETLLSIEAVDNIDPDRNVTNTNKELIAQGIGNSVSGLIGGLPITSVIVRSSANIDAGGKTKISTITHGILLLGCVIAIPTLINKIPLSALSAILLLTGYKLCKLNIFKKMYSNGKYQFIPFLITISTIILIDLFGVVHHLKGEGLLIGVLAGLVTSFGAILHGNLKNSYFFHKENHHKNDVIKIHLSEEVSFLNKASLRETLDHIPENSKVIIDATNTKYIDFDVLELIKEFRDIKSHVKNIKCQLIGFKEIYKINNTYSVISEH